MKINATFNTNTLKMLLIVAMSIINIHMSFSACYFFAIFEFKEAFNFYIQCMHEKIFDDCSDLKIIIVNQSKVLDAFLSISMSEAQLQLCNWHAVKNITTRMKKSKIEYSLKRRQKITNAAWLWVISDIIKTLEINRAVLLTLLHSLDKKYFWINWYCKETKMIFCYTRRYHNLSVVVSQRSQSTFNWVNIEALLNTEAEINVIAQRFVVKHALSHSDAALPNSKLLSEIEAYCYDAHSLEC